MAIREINSTWHDTARRVGLPPDTSRAPTGSHPPTRWRPFSVPAAALPSPAISEAPRTSPRVGAQGDRDRRRHSVSWYRARNVVRICCGRYRSLTRLVYALTIIFIRRFVYLSG
jgi:hypothetical protein